MDNVYNFHIKPVMPEWKKLKTHNEMLEVLQIPTDIMKSMTTKLLS